jgi:hypothetical protein
MQYVSVFFVFLDILKKISTIYKPSENLKFSSVVVTSIKFESL